MKRNCFRFKKMRHVIVGFILFLKIKLINFSFTKCKCSVLMFLFCSLIIAFCITEFYYCNRIPNREIEVCIRKYGDIDSTLCAIFINMDYGGAQKSDKTKGNLVYVKTYLSPQASPLFPKTNRDRKIMLNEKGKYRQLAQIFKDSLNNTYAMVSLAYKCYSNINHLDVKGRDIKVYKDRSLLYMYKPKKKHDKNGVYIDGRGYALFPNFPYPKVSFNFTTNIDNLTQSFLFPWDISQTNIKYRMHIDGKCKILKFEYYDIVNFSQMYPIPDKITATSCEFTDITKIREIGMNGLTFHVDFVNNKNLLELRNLIITAILSLMIGILCNKFIK